MPRSSTFLFFFFNDTATTEIYTLSLHDALPISVPESLREMIEIQIERLSPDEQRVLDRKSTRLNSSHSQISYAVFCLKKKKNNTQDRTIHKRTPRIDCGDIHHSESSCSAIVSAD